MSYKSKKLRKSKFKRFKYELGLFRLALITWARPLWLLMKAGRRDRERMCGGLKRREGVRVFQKEKVLGVLKKYDRMVGNPDFSRLEQAITSQVQREGLLRLCVFVCPKFNPEALFFEIPENYMPVEAGPDLFESRIAKIISLRDDLMAVGLLTEINLLIGDNDAEEYIFPFIQTLTINSSLYRQRQVAYRLSFEQRCRRLFGGSRCLVWSLAENGVSMDVVRPAISREDLEKELNFFKWLFSDRGPYRGMLIFPERTLAEMVYRKYQLYGAQGKFLEMIGGILLQTEGPGVWLERTNMLKSTGSSAIPAIYPWIRKDEVVSGR